MNVKQQVETILEISISNDELADARQQAERKLERIIENEGDADGRRREEWYLVRLIAEFVRQNRITKFTTDLMRCIIKAEKQVC